ncbi:hypothetical protein MNBD_GAMMA17-2129 [hydrothermal vent metagenome]|uniref:Uncharacterized protein n=1 Tax=hydrothermal vent metagenome TaxID=652676 RepID=A0A3B0YZ63_9ZZZZ
MEYLIFTVRPLDLDIEPIELGQFTIIAGVVYWVVRNIKNEKAREEKQN